MCLVSGCGQRVQDPSRLVSSSLGLGLLNADHPIQIEVQPRQLNLAGLWVAPGEGPRVPHRIWLSPREEKHALLFEMLTYFPSEQVSSPHDKRQSEKTFAADGVSLTNATFDICVLLQEQPSTVAVYVAASDLLMIRTDEGTEYRRVRPQKLLFNLLQMCAAQE